MRYIGDINEATETDKSSNIQGFERPEAIAISFEMMTLGIDPSVNRDLIRESGYIPCNSRIVIHPSKWVDVFVLPFTHQQSLRPQFHQ
ncbi:hypothetical protein AJ88_23990 [Mesorhizobium amorphae CCBAU 01583]|nr:hypothetical protein AJ88_23990 [Mesorhizobium amorphae CCBAU 01583]